MNGSTKKRSHFLCPRVHLNSNGNIPNFRRKILRVLLAAVVCRHALRGTRDPLLCNPVILLIVYLGNTSRRLRPHHHDDIYLCACDHRHTYMQGGTKATTAVRSHEHAVQLDDFTSTAVVIMLASFRTAVPFWGQTSLISSSLSPKRDCGSKGVKNNGARSSSNVEQLAAARSCCCSGRLFGTFC